MYLYWSQIFIVKNTIQHKYDKNMDNQKEKIEYIQSETIRQIGIDYKRRVLCNLTHIFYNYCEAVATPCINIKYQRIAKQISYS